VGLALGLAVGLALAPSRPRALKLESFDRCAPATQVRARTDCDYPPTRESRASTMGGIVGTILVGLVVGAIARFIMPGEQKRAGPLLPD